VYVCLGPFHFAFGSTRDKAIVRAAARSAPQPDDVGKVFHFDSCRPRAAEHKGCSHVMAVDFPPSATSPPSFAPTEYFAFDDRATRDSFLAGLQVTCDHSPTPPLECLQASAALHAARGCRHELLRCGSERERCDAHDLRRVLRRKRFDAKPALLPTPGLQLLLLLQLHPAPMLPSTPESCRCHKDGKLCWILPAVSTTATRG